MTTANREKDYACDYCGSDYTDAKYCCAARREYLNAHGEFETGRAPAASVGSDWRIDTSAGGPILVYQNCSVIEGEQAEYVLRLIAADAASVGDAANYAATLQALLTRLVISDHVSVAGSDGALAAALAVAIDSLTASVGDAPSDAVAWQKVVGIVTNWRTGVMGSNEAMIEIAEFIKRTAPPAAPVVSNALIDRALNRRAVAPWPDSAGNAIHDMDRIRHPDGTTGTVLYLPAMGAGGEAWRVVYEHGDIARLALQIGDKGQAVVIERLSVPATDDKAPAVDAEPVAWRYRVVTNSGARGEWFFSADETKTEGCIEAEPLYAAPTSPHDVDAVRVDEAMVERFVDAYDDVYEAEVVARGVWSDNKNAAVIAGLTAALRKSGEGA